MGLLNAWFNVHKGYINEKLTRAGFIRLWVPNDYLQLISRKNDGIRYASQIIDGDSLSASDRTDSLVKKGDELQRNFRDIEEYQSRFKKMLNTYERKFLSEDTEITKEFWNQLESALKKFKDTNGKKEYSIGCEHLIYRIHHRKDTKDTHTDLLYAYLYFALFNFLPEEFGYNDYAKYEEDFNEYRKLIIDSLGIYSFTGMAMLYALAERGMDKKINQKDADLKPNIVALFTKGQLEYYGRGPSGKRDIPAAYECYKKVRDLNPYHPMARWAIADLKLSYESGQIKCEIEDFENEKRYRDKSNFVDEQEEENKPQYTYSKEWYVGIREDLIMASSYGSAPAENLLGRIIQGKDKEGKIIFPEEYLGSLANERPEEHYKKSADRGYVFAYINLYEFYKHKAEDMNKSDGKALCKIAFNYLLQAADWGLPYAANKISRYFLGNVDDIVAKVVIPDEDKAFKYAKRALRYAKMIHNGYWPFYNIVEFFYFNEKSHYYKKIEVKEMKNYLKLAKDNCREDSKDRSDFFRKVGELEKRMDQEK